MRRSRNRSKALQGKSIEDQIARLRDLDLTGLRTCWQNEFGRPAPKHLTRYLLTRILAYKIQADRLGDLDSDTLKVLERVGGNDRQSSFVSKELAVVDQRRFAPPPGTVLVREWDRRSHHVMVLTDGFAWNGNTFDSLSQVAFAITGTKWNGPRFLRPAGSASAGERRGSRMKSTSIQKVRCAIYTRVSTDQGLDQDFNSLDAQYEASSAYIKSQAHAGWTLIRSRYDDGGYSGGSTDRPNLQRLLDDVRVRKIDVIVVYKVDRLTRSLADFAKLVDLFDAHDASFVSVTQQSNTTTSMGRLTLNVLLSFAQFEREVTSERIRDKIAASKRRGLWVGGPLPLGYDIKDGKFLVVEEEAERVRFVFRRYLEVGGINELARDLRAKNICTRARTLSTTGKTRGGVPFGRGTLSHLLRNRFFIGEVTYRGEVLPGEQPAILKKSLFEAVQQKLSAHQSHQILIRQKSDHLLKDLLFDDAGHRMIATHATKAGVRYRYYVSQPGLHGEARTAKLGSISRVPAPEIEQAIVSAVQEQLAEQKNGTVCAPPIKFDHAALASLVSRIEVQKNRLVVP